MTTESINKLRNDLYFISGVAFVVIMLHVGPTTSAGNLAGTVALAFIARYWLVLLDSNDVLERVGRRIAPKLKSTTMNPQSAEAGDSK